MFAALMGVAISYVLINASKALRITKTAITTAEDIIEDSNKSVTNENKHKREVSTMEIQEEAQSIIKEAKKSRKTTIVVVTLFAFYLIAIYTFYFLPHGLWTDYQQDLTKIAPYIEQQDLNQIKSDWACMQSKEDYDAIYKRINEIKAEHNLP